MVNITCPIMEAVLKEDVDDLVVDEVIDVGGVDTSELDDDDLNPPLDEPSDDITDVDIMAGDVYDVPDDVEVPDVDDLPTVRDLREVERAAKQLVYMDEDDDEDDDDSIVNFAVYNDADPDTEEIDVPEWAQDMDTSPGSYVPPVIERITYDDMMESGSFEEFLEKSYKRSISEETKDVTTNDINHPIKQGGQTDEP